MVTNSDTLNYYEPRVSGSKNLLPYVQIRLKSNEMTEEKIRLLRELGVKILNLK